MTTETPRILLVRPTGLALLETAFGRRGPIPTFQIAKSISEAITTLGQSPIDAVLHFGPADLPCLTDLVEAAAGASPRVPVFIIGDRTPDDEETLLANGAAGVVSDDRIDRLPGLVRRELGNVLHPDSIDAGQERALLQMQLVQAQKMEALGTLAGGIAHDFNNILMGILGNAEMARDELEGWSPVHGYLSEILRASYRARDVVQRILTFSRKRAPNWQRVALSGIVDDAVALLRATLPATIELHVRRHPDAPAIDGDRDQLHQVVVNLVTNAAQAIGAGSGTITITETIVDVDRDLARGNVRLTERRYVVLSVADSGPGMTRDTLGRIFEPFFTTRPPGQGTGLGLAVVHGIIEEHGGAITVDSAPGSGTTFGLYFPAMGQSAPTAADLLSEAPRGRGQHVLLVDDEAAIVRIGRHMLERLDYQVTAVSSAAEAIEAFDANPDRYDLVLSDLTMPGMTGVELARHLRSRNPAIRFVLTTGHPDAFEHGCPPAVDAILSKPFALAKLAHLLDQILGSRMTR